MTKGCVLDLRFQDKQGSVVTDYSRYGNDGAVHGGAEWTEHGMKFNGSSGYVNCGDIIDINKEDHQTISAWIKTTTDGKYIIGKHDYSDPYQGWDFSMYSNSIKYEYMSATTNRLFVYGDVNIVDNIWHHVIAIRTGTRAADIILYVDGILQVNSILKDTIPNSVNIPNHLYIGARDAQDNFFDGNIDQVQIFNYALPLHEIKSMYDARRYLYD